MELGERQCPIGGARNTNQQTTNTYKKTKNTCKNTKKQKNFESKFACQPDRGKLIV
jgi:hypothetical protein